MTKPLVISTELLNRDLLNSDHIVWKLASENEVIVTDPLTAADPVMAYTRQGKIIYSLYPPGPRPYNIDSRGNLPVRGFEERGQEDYWRSGIVFFEMVTSQPLPPDPIIDGKTWDFVAERVVAKHSEVYVVYPGERRGQPNTQATADVRTVASNEFTFSEGSATENVMFYLTPGHPWTPDIEPEIPRRRGTIVFRVVRMDNDATLMEFPIPDQAWDTWRIIPFRIENELRKKYGSTLARLRIKVELRFVGLAKTKCDANGSPLGHEVVNAESLGIISGFGVLPMRQRT